jgi:protein tyrosine/serine phosphatase
MSAHRIPEKKDLNFLFNLYKNKKKAPRPILIHCRGGADRTGEAAALWVITQQKKSKKIALKQLSLKYGHIRYKAPLKRRFVKLFTNIDDCKF